MVEGEIYSCLGVRRGLQGEEKGEIDVEQELDHERTEQEEVETEKELKSDEEVDELDEEVKSDEEVDELGQEEEVLEVEGQSVLVVEVQPLLEVEGQPVLEVNQYDSEQDLIIMMEEVEEEGVEEMKETVMEVNSDVEIIEGDLQLTTMDSHSKQQSPCCSRPGPNLSQRTVKPGEVYSYIYSLGQSGVKRKLREEQDVEMDVEEKVETSEGFQILRQDMWLCRYCKRSFILQIDQINHIRAAHNGKKVDCPNCGKRFSTQGNMKAHMKKVDCLKLRLPQTDLKKHFSKKNVLGCDREFGPWLWQLAKQ